MENMSLEELKGKLESEKKAEEVKITNYFWKIWGWSIPGFIVFWLYWLTKAPHRDDYSYDIQFLHPEIIKEAENTWGYVLFLSPVVMLFILLFTYLYLDSYDKQLAENKKKNIFHLEYKIKEIQSDRK